MGQGAPENERMADSLAALEAPGRRPMALPELIFGLVPAPEGHHVHHAQGNLFPTVSDRALEKTSCYGGEQQPLRVSADPQLSCR